jgi:hypothetical protein
VPDVFAGALEANREDNLASSEEACTAFLAGRGDSLPGIQSEDY